MLADYACITKETIRAQLFIVCAFATLGFRGNSRENVTRGTHPVAWTSPQRRRGTLYSRNGREFKDANLLKRDLKVCIFFRKMLQCPAYPYISIRMTLFVQPSINISIQPSTSSQSVVDEVAINDQRRSQDHTMGVTHNYLAQIFLESYGMKLLPIVQGDFWKQITAVAAIKCFLLLLQQHVIKYVSSFARKSCDLPFVLSMELNTSISSRSRLSDKLWRPN